MDAKHIVIAKMFEEEINSLLKGNAERQPTKKNVIISSESISKKIISKIPSKKRMCHIKKF